MEEVGFFVKYSLICVHEGKFGKIRVGSIEVMWNKAEIEPFIVRFGKPMSTLSWPDLAMLGPVAQW